MDRISPLADKVINESQSAFIKGRNILEGVVTLHEIVHELSRTRRQGVLFKINFEKAYDKVHWDFVQEVMEKKDSLIIGLGRPCALFRGGGVCINVNGERTPFFRTFQGLRQGDPLSPLVFNLLAETLASLMMKASKQRKLRGVLTHLIPEGITHIQYAYDTILMVEGDDASVINMKFILYCFEWLLA
jgi:hypothetical protein